MGAEMRGLNPQIQKQSAFFSVNMHDIKVEWVFASR